MKLHYYDDVTPPDYEPPLFRPGSYEDTIFCFPADPTRIKIGSVNSNHHKVDVRMYTAVDSIQEEGPQASLPEEPIITQTKPSKTEEKDDAADKAPSSIQTSRVNHAPIQGSQLSQELIAQSDPDSQKSDTFQTNHQEIRCLCKDLRSDGGMILCDGCKTWQHLPCEGYYDEDDSRIPDSFLCFHCRYPEANPRQIAMACELMRYRRLICIMWFDSAMTSVNATTSRLRMNQLVRTRLRKRLISDGFLAENYKGCPFIRNQKNRQFMEKLMSEETLREWLNIDQAPTPSPPNEAAQEEQKEITPAVINSKDPLYGDMEKANSILVEYTAKSIDFPAANVTDQQRISIDSKYADEQLKQFGSRMGDLILSEGNQPNSLDTPQATNCSMTQATVLVGESGTTSTLKRTFTSF